MGCACNRLLDGHAALLPHNPPMIRMVVYSSTHGLGRHDSHMVYGITPPHSLSRYVHSGRQSTQPDFDHFELRELFGRGTARLISLLLWRWLVYPEAVHCSGVGSHVHMGGRQ